jgi:hypothetical protein
MAEEQTSFMDRVSQRMNPASEVMDQETTPELEEAMEELKEEKTESEEKEEVEETEEEEMDENTLYETVYDETYNAEDPKSQNRMETMKAEIARDPRVKEMAMSSPEKFALYMYTRARPSA